MTTRRCKSLFLFFTMLWLPVLLIGLERAMQLHG